MSDVYVYSIFVLFLVYIGWLVFRYFKVRVLSDIQANRFLFSVYSRRNLYDLTPREFENWCAYLLRRLGYRDVTTTSASNDGGKDIICKRDGKKIYVECKKYMFKELAEHLNRENKYSRSDNEKGEFSEKLVGRDILQKLVGAMVGDGVHRGIVITTSDFHANAIEYIMGLPEEYQVELIDGRTLCNMYEEIIEEEYDRQIRIPDIHNIHF